eukprot:scaffold13.g299.t1
MESQQCLYPSASVALMVVMNATVDPTAAAPESLVPPAALASATGYRALDALDAALPSRILGDWFVISWFPPDPRSNHTRLTVARTLNTWSGVSSADLVLAVQDVINASTHLEGSPLSSSWDVYLPAATIVTYGLADVLSGLTYSSTSVADSPACTVTKLAPRQAGMPQPSPWVVFNRSVAAAAVSAPGAVPTSAALSVSVAQQYLALSADAFNASHETFSFTSASGRSLSVPTLRQMLLSWDGASLAATSTWGVVPSSTLNISDLQAELSADDGTIYLTDPSGTNTSLTSQLGQFALINSSGCLPPALDQAASLALDQVAETFNASTSPPPSAPAQGGGSSTAGGAPAGSSVSGGGSGTNMAAIAAGAAVGGAALLAGGAWLLLVLRRRRRLLLDSEADEESLSKLVDSALNTKFLIPFCELRLRKRLGEGAFGVVWLALWHETPVAVKLLQAQAAGEAPTQLSPAALAALRKASRAWGWESDLMASLRHPNVVLYLGLSAEPGTAALVMEYCSRGSLLDRILQAQQDQSKLPWALRLNLAFGAAKGMLYLHTRSPPILHRDLKARTSSVMAQVVREQAATSVASSMLGGPGNPRWLAPEVLRGAPATPQSDVFSFGVVLWELLALQLPWAAHDTWGIVGAVQEGQRAPVPPAAACPGFRCHAAYAALLAQCWAQDPAQRPGFGEVCARLRNMVAVQAKSNKQLKADAGNGSRKGGGKRKLRDDIDEGL